MMVLAVVYLVLIVVMCCALAFTPDHKFEGYPASVTILGLFVAGGILAVHSL